MSCYFTKIFVHLFITTAVSNFNVYCDPANIYRLKVNSSTLEKGMNIVLLSSIVNFELISHLFLMFLLFLMNS